MSELGRTQPQATINDLIKENKEIRADMVEIEFKAFLAGYKVGRKTRVFDTTSFQYVRTCFENYKGE